MSKKEKKKKRHVEEQIREDDATYETVYPNTHADYLYAMIFILLFILCITMLLALFTFHSQFKALAELTALQDAATQIRVPDGVDIETIKGVIK